MKEEKALQNRIIECLADNGQYVVVGALCPGHPDLTTFKDGHSALIEIKDISEMSENERFGTCLTRAQLPWMMHFQRNNYGTTFIAMRYKKKSMLFLVDSMPAVTFLKDSKVKDVLERSFTFVEVMPMVKYILKFTKSIMKKAFLSHVPKILYLLAERALIQLNGR